MIYKLNDYIIWKPTITWNNFKSKKEDDYVGATIHTNFGGTVNKVFNYPPALVFAVMSESKSWTSEDYRPGTNEDLLKHEQRHFDVKEIFAQKAQDSVNQVWGKSSSQIKDIVMHFKEKAISFNKYYDEITDHGINENEQKIFDKKILQLLNK